MIYIFLFAYNNIYINNLALMPSCSGNKKAPMTGGGVRSMLRRAKSGLRKLTKRNKPTPTRNEEYEMVDLSPKIATTRFGSKSKYNNRAAHRQGVADLERYVKQLQEEVKELTQQSEIAQTAHGQCMDREAKRLGNPALTKELEAAVEKLAKAEKQLEKEHAEVIRLYDANGEAERKLMYVEKELAEAKRKKELADSGHIGCMTMSGKLVNEKKQLTKELDAAVAKLAECESIKSSLGRRAASAERRTQRRFPVSKQNIARGASSMSLMRTMRNTNAVAKKHNAFMAQQNQKYKN